VRNSLRNEVGLLKKISGGKLQALKNYLHTLAEFFPSDKRDMTLFLTKLSSWILPYTEIDVSLCTFLLYDTIECKPVSISNTTITSVI